MKKKNKYNHALVEEYLKNRYDKKEMSQIVSRTKKNNLYSDFSTVLAKLRSFDTNVDYNYFGSQWPISYEELGKCNDNYVIPQSLDNEILWIIYQVKKYKTKLSSFVKKRDMVERLILLAEYDDALSLLEDINVEFGVSIWFLEMKILIYMYQGKRSKALELVSDINKLKTDKSSGFVPLILHCLVKRSEVDLSAYNFDTFLENWMKRSVSNFQKIRQKYLQFKVNMFRSFEYASEKTNLLFEGTNSLIDRYIYTLNIIKVNFVCNPKARNFYSAYGNLLYEYTKDISLLPYLAYLGKEMPEYYFDAKYVGIIDKYYTGKYKDVCEASRSYIKNNYISIDLLKFYCRSLIYLKNGYIKIVENESSILNKIALNMYHQMAGDNDQHYWYKLYQLCKNISGFNIASALDTYIREEKSDSPNLAMSMISSPVYDPIFSKLFETQNERLKYLDLGILQIPQSIVLQYDKQKILGEITNDERIVDYIRMVDNAQIFYEKGNFDESINIMNKVLCSNKDCTPIVQTAVKCIYDCLTKKGCDEDAILFYVDWLVKNKSYISKIITDELIRKLKKLKYSGLKLTIDLIIFVLRNAIVKTDKAFIVEKYAKYKGLENIEQIVNSVKNRSVEMQECFLTQLLDEDFFNHTILVDSSKAILENQGLIAQRLIELDTPDRSDYENFSRMITQQLIVYEGAEKMDDSKIYADGQSIIRYETEEARRFFDQFAVQNKLEHTPQTVFLILDPSSECAKENNEISLGMTYVYTNDYLKEISLQLFNSICKPYLKSKFGIGAYLSARIRHGVIDGQLLPGFQERELSLISSGNNYIPSIYWREHFPLTKDDLAILNRAQTIFSKGLNELILKYKMDVLQIRTKDDEKGMFDYRMTDEEICYYVRNAYGNGCEFEEFCHNLLLLLNNKTNESLEKIKIDIRERLKPEILGLVDSLLENTLDITCGSFNTAFRERVEDAKRDVKTRLDKMEHWFNIIDYSKLEDTSLFNHILVLWNVATSMSSPRINCILEKQKNADELKRIVIKGEYSIHIRDIFWIFFTNMIKHSKVEPNRCFSIEHNINGDLITIQMVNNFEGDEEEVNRKFEALLSSTDRLQKEGGSGLVKARKIVKFDLKCDKNEVYIRAKEGKCIATIIINLKYITV